MTLCLWLGWAPAWAGADSGADDPGPVILIVGDSLGTAHGVAAERAWTTLLRRRLREAGLAYRVVNASISGETSAGGRSRLPGLLEREQPEVVIIELGGNDGLRGLSLTQTRDNLAAMIEAAQGAGARVLLAGMRLPPNYGRQYTEAFAAIYDDLAGHYDVALIPFLLEGIGRDRDLMQADGIHPNAAAQPRILANLWPHLRPLLGPSGG